MNKQLTIKTMKTRKIKNPKNDTIDPRIVTAYSSHVRAEKELSDTMKRLTPKFDLKIGDKILLTRYKDYKPIKCIVQRLRYDPYYGDSFGGWHICTKPCDKNWKEILTRYSIWIKQDMEIELVSN